jgi:RNA polymerase sigma-70 factor (ECF subfamily)
VLRLLGADFYDVLADTRRQNQQAFARLWRGYQPGLLRYLTMLVGEAAADDVASETWMSVVRGLHRFTGDEPGFRAWLMTIARNRAIDYMRQRRRNPLLLDGPEALADRLPASPDAATIAVEQLTARAAVGLIAKVLSPAQAEAVILRAVVGLDVAEAARVMGRREGTIRVLTHRGLRRLADHLDEPLNHEAGRRLST